MHSKNYGTALLQILMIVGFTILPVNAHEVEVSYVPQDYELKTFHMEVRIQGQGAVLDQGLTLKNPTFFALHSDEKKQFVLQPAQGYEIADIQYDGEDITNLLQQQTLTVKGKDHDTKLIVTFCKQSQNPRKDTATVETGDSIATAGYLSIIFLSAGFIIFVKKKKEKLHDRR